jgi:hypothetical protein
LGHVRRFLVHNFDSDKGVSVALPRKSLVSYTFPDGTVVPPGMIISAAPTGAQHDEEYYERAEEFDGLRFWKLRDGDATKGLDGSEELKHRLTSASPGFLAFGAGRHIWYGFRPQTWLLSLIHVVLVRVDSLARWNSNA